MRKYIENADGSSTYVTAEDDMVDEIAFDFYGHHQRTAEAIYDANPSLSEQPMHLPAGITIRLPVITVADPVTEQVQLWT